MVSRFVVLFLVSFDALYYSLAIRARNIEWIALVLDFRIQNSEVCTNTTMLRSWYSISLPLWQSLAVGRSFGFVSTAVKSQAFLKPLDRLVFGIGFDLTASYG